MVHPDSTIIKEKLIHKGAEAHLYYGSWFGKDVIFKHRIPKEYRNVELDKSIRMTRTLNEARALISVKELGLNVPVVYDIDTKEAVIITKQIKGKILKKELPNLNYEKKQMFFKELGKYIAILHTNSHIHGDITTSNIIVTENNDLFIIDFGLHSYSDKVEDKSVDIHLLKRVLISSHGNDYKICYDAFLEGYQSGYKKEEINMSKQIIRNIKVIETRGRYIKREERL